jgi:8-hydroxy-5-deazaflavin:NADPH oxidoreductase
MQQHKVVCRRRLRRFNLQKRLPKSRVVKAFNAVFSAYMETGRLGDHPLTAFVAGDDAGAKTSVMGLARDIGFKLLHG